jgi:hypothetical protein
VDDKTSSAIMDRFAEACGAGDESEEAVGRWT